MGTLVDIANLVTQLVDRIEDRKAASDLREIQGMIATLQSEQTKLNEDNIKLMSENAELKGKIAELGRELIQARSPQPQPDEDLDEIATKILKLIADTPQNLTNDMVKSHLSLSKAKGDYYFDQLRDSKYIASPGGQVGVGMFWIATKEGREYLASRGLLE